MDKKRKGFLAYFSGHTAEKEALIFLKKKGYRLVAKNVVIGRGTGAMEIDLILLQEKMLVFVEIKKRRTTEEALQAITPRLQQRFYKAAEAFLAAHPEYREYDCRFDVVLITPAESPLHLENVIWG